MRQLRVYHAAVDLRYSIDVWDKANQFLSFENLECEPWAGQAPGISERPAAHASRLICPNSKLIFPDVWETPGTGVATGTFSFVA